MAKNENSNFSYMTRRIGGTTYKVKVVFSDTSVVVFLGTYAPLLRSAYGELLRHSAVSSTHVFRQSEMACRIVCNEWSVFA